MEVPISFAVVAEMNLVEFEGKSSAVMAARVSVSGNGLALTLENMKF